MLWFVRILYLVTGLAFAVEAWRGVGATARGLAENRTALADMRAAVQEIKAIEARTGRLPTEAELGAMERRMIAEGRLTQEYGFIYHLGRVAIETWPASVKGWGLLTQKGRPFATYVSTVDYYSLTEMVSWLDYRGSWLAPILSAAVLLGLAAVVRKTDPRGLAVRRLPQEGDDARYPALPPEWPMGESLMAGAKACVAVGAGWVVRGAVTGLAGGHAIQGAANGFAAGFMFALLAVVAVAPVCFCIVIPTAAYLPRDGWFWRPAVAPVFGAVVGATIPMHGATLGGEGFVVFEVFGAIIGAITYFLLACTLRGGAGGRRWWQVLGAKQPAAMSTE